MGKTNTVRVVLHVKAKADKVEELRALLTGLVAPTQAEPGCIAYELFHNIADPTDFAYIEEWDNTTLLDAHMQTKHVQAALGVIGPLIDGGIDRRIFSK